MHHSPAAAHHRTKPFLRTMPRSAEGTMLTRLLGLLLLSYLCSAMLTNTTTSGNPNTSEPVTIAPGYQGSIRSGHLGLPPNGSDPQILSVGGPNPDVCAMLWHTEIPPPISQVPWQCICTHCNSSRGTKGDHGDQGPPGAAGSPGVRGPTGFRGPRGFTGRPGVKGQKGDAGEKGLQGNSGFIGSKGARGFKGEKGDRGVEGPSGGLGLKGEKGTCPDSCGNTKGDKGDRGDTGPPGEKGLPGVKGDMGATGFRGDKGDRGGFGVPGTKGNKGALGEKGLCDCNDGTDGTDGERGPKGDKGDEGDVGMKGDEGVEGEKGNQGEKGMSGPIGPCTPAIQSAFSASLNESFPAPDLPIPFPDVITNRQGHFNPTLGIYHAPVNGTYVFSFHASVSSRVLKIGLFYNFFPIARTTEITNEATTSHQTVLHLYRGDMVWLQVKDTMNNGMFNSPEHKSTFSGYLLYPDSCELPVIRNGPPAGPTVTPTYKWDPPTTTTKPSK